MKRLSYKMVASVLSSIDFLFAIFSVLPDTRSITVYYLSKWVLVNFFNHSSFFRTGYNQISYGTKAFVCFYIMNVLKNKIQNGGKKMKKMMLLLSKFTCVMAMVLAVVSVNSTCCFTAYQPDVPKSLDYKQI
mgnify:CR=1 FL=1